MNKNQLNEISKTMKNCAKLLTFACGVVAITSAPSMAKEPTYSNLANLMNHNLEITADIMNAVLPGQKFEKINLPETGKAPTQQEYDKIINDGINTTLMIMNEALNTK